MKSRKKYMRGGRHGTIEDYMDGVYIGDIWNDKPHGKGKWRDDIGTYYDGEWLLGKKNGKGIMTFPNNTKYVGRWMNNKRHGLGSMHYDSGKVATGMWRNDEPIEKFIMKWPNKDNKLPNHIILDATEIEDFEADDHVSDADTE
jgi:hypothetical protein